MRAQTHRLTADTVELLPAACRTCLVWELDPVRRARCGDHGAEKAHWVSEVLREWGSCGRLVMMDDTVIGYAIWAPASYLPGMASFPTAPASADAVVLAGMRVEPEWTGHGIGRVLIQQMAGDLVRRQHRAVETFADHDGRTGHCVLPLGFLTAVGFRTQRDHPTRPRMRMDLRTTVAWRDEVEHALERLLAGLRPAPATERAAAPDARRP
ncbi:GNAT family N-acetyltransferase [Nocardioides limicola]|uniref:GNAT family N-acetyltransferase n=1 Tax=Nocardioides limicola TaxID=2803368 RepID=UPI00193C53CA|nr:GNAT family N-acetyltransferase [Nocardioides sp. DJM-14]